MTWVTPSHLLIPISLQTITKAARIIFKEKKKIYLRARIGSNRPAQRPVHIWLKQSVLLLYPKPNLK